MDVQHPGADERFAMLPWERLRDKTITVDGKPYAAYKTLEGAYRFDRFVLYIDEVITEPPGVQSPIRVRVDQAEARFPPDLWSTPVRRAALEDFIARRWLDASRKVGRARAGRGGIGVEAGGQEIALRTACRIAEDWVEVRAHVLLPSEGRKASTKAVQPLLLEDLSQIVEAVLFYPNHNPGPPQRHIEVAEDAQALRAQLQDRGLVAFLADGSVLPREGDSGKPLLSRLVTWQAPEELRVSLSAPHRGEIIGLGVPRGVTVILGHAFSGRSTLLAAMASGIYTHLPGDGREYCVTVPDAALIGTDEGRRVEGVDLTPFLSALPDGEDSSHVRVEHAPGLVAQAASISEALEVGTTLLLVDEDACAPRLLARDVLWRHLAPEARDPVTPLADLVRPLYAEHGVSSVIAAASGSSLPGVADTIIAMDAFRPTVATTRAKQLAGSWPGVRVAEVRGFGGIHHRVPVGESLQVLHGRRLRPSVSDTRTLVLGRESVDLHALSQLVDPAQTRAIGAALMHAVERGYFDGTRTVREVLSLIDADVAAQGLDVLSPQAYPSGEYMLPRRQEIAAALNRLRVLRVRS